MFILYYIYIMLYTNTNTNTYVIILATISIRITYVIFSMYHIIFLKGVFTKDDLWRSYYILSFNHSCCRDSWVSIIVLSTYRQWLREPVEGGLAAIWHFWRTCLKFESYQNFPFCPSTWVEIKYFCILWVFHIVLHKLNLNTIVTFVV